LFDEAAALLPPLFLLISVGDPGGQPARGRSSTAQKLLLTLRGIYENYENSHKECI
jgi:hypothetical protein